jgi:hypothetical protein
MESNLLTKLPREILHHIFKHFLDLPELWCLTKVSRDLNAIATSIIKKQWFIDNKTPMLATSLLKIQTHAAMINLSSITLRLIQRIKIYDPYAYPPFLSVDRYLKQQRRRQQEREEFPLFSTEEEAAAAAAAAATQSLADEHEGDYDYYYDDDSDISSICTTSSPPLTSFTFPPTIEPGLDDIVNETGFIMERFKYHSERLHHMLSQETQLHQRILQGLLTHMFSGQMDYPIGSAMDVIFHHAVSITSERAFQCRIAQQRLLRRPNLSVVLACTSSEMRCFAAAISRLFCAMMTRFAHSESIITTALWYKISVFWTFTEHRLSGAIQALPANSIVEDMLLNTHNTHVDQVLLILFRITAYLNLVGACYVAQILKESDTEQAIFKLCEVLEKQQLLAVKKVMLLNWADVWLGMDRHAGMRFFIRQKL